MPIAKTEQFLRSLGRRPFGFFIFSIAYWLLLVLTAAMAEARPVAMPEKPIISTEKSRSAPTFEATDDAENDLSYLYLWHDSSNLQVELDGQPLQLARPGTGKLYQSPSGRHVLRFLLAGRPRWQEKLTLTAQKRVDIVSHEASNQLSIHLLENLNIYDPLPDAYRYEPCAEDLLLAQKLRKLSYPWQPTWRTPLAALLLAAGGVALTFGIYEHGSVSQETQSVWLLTTGSLISAAGLSFALWDHYIPAEDHF